jgi:hypothetical protein
VNFLATVSGSAVAIGMGSLFLPEEV